MCKLNIYITDDDVATAKIYQYRLAVNPNNIISIFHTGKELLDNLDQDPDIIFLDYHLPGENTESIIKEIQTRKPDIPLIIISGQQDITVIIKLLKSNIYDYVSKGTNVIQRLEDIVKQVRNEKMKK